MVESVPRPGPVGGRYNMAAAPLVGVPVGGIPPQMKTEPSGRATALTWYRATPSGKLPVSHIEVVDAGMSMTAIVVAVVPAPPPTTRTRSGSVGDRRSTSTD